MSEKTGLLARILRTSKPAEPKMEPTDDERKKALGTGAAREAGEKVSGRKAQVEKALREAGG